MEHDLSREQPTLRARANAEFQNLSTKAKAQP
jgi:hypothetical protein